MLRCSIGVVRVAPTLHRKAIVSRASVTSHITKNPWVVLVIICFAQFMVVLDATIVNVALPSIQRDLHLSSASLQWIVNAFNRVLDIGSQLFDGGFADYVQQILFPLHVVVQRGFLHSEESCKIARAGRFVSVFGEHRSGRTNEFAQRAAM